MLICDVDQAEWRHLLERGEKMDALTSRHVKVELFSAKLT